MPDQLQPRAVAKDEGAPIWFLGTQTWVKAKTVETTGGCYSLIEQVIPAGFATPYHKHHAEDESFYIVDGDVTFIVDGKKIRVGPGAYVFGPREIPHGFRVEGSEACRMLIFATPGGFENFVIEMSEPAPPTGPPDMAKLMTLAAKYNIDILGPLPD
jgi:quercetin dioxygenase-like cupin family protein